MIEAVLSGLIVAAVSGLTFLAYKHPKGYSKIGYITDFFLSFAFLIYVIWVFGYQQGFYAGQNATGDFAHPEVPIEPFPWLIIIVFVVQVYLSFLKRLPKILEPDKNESDGDEEK